MGNSQYCYRLANMAGYYILQSSKMRAFNIHKLCQKMYIFQIISWLQVDKQPYYMLVAGDKQPYYMLVAGDKQAYYMLVAGDKQAYYMLVAGG